MKRRDVLSGMLAVPLMFSVGSAEAAEQPFEQLLPLWEAWKGRFLQPDGRVVDDLQSSASHSEGQGYGLTLAATLGDEEAFRLIMGWTEANLAVRNDALLAWRWLPSQSVAGGTVPDTNNASDGDLFYAWGLQRGAETFGDPSMAELAGRIAADLAAKCTTPSPEDAMTLLFLPAAYGFVQDTGVVVNPSYYMVRAMRELGAAHGVRDLVRCADHGEALLTRLGLRGPVPDWVEVTEEGLRAADGFSPQNGYEALRVPLYLIWSGLVSHPAVIAAYTPGSSRALPGPLTATVVDISSGTVLESSQAPGYRAIDGLVSCSAESGQGAVLPSFSVDQPYFPATLHMMALVAQIENLPECFPI